MERREQAAGGAVEDVERFEPLLQDPPRLPAARLPLWTLVDAEEPLLVAALHDGHTLRPEVERHLRADARTRWGEEDPDFLVGLRRLLATLTPRLLAALERA